MPVAAGSLEMAAPALWSPPLLGHSLRHQLLAQAERNPQILLLYVVALAAVMIGICGFLGSALLLILHRY